MTTAARRRTQEERSAHTRAKVLQATIDSLDAVGYAATTTRRVAELAGVSQGAITYHFPRRVDLVVAAVQHVAGERMDAVHMMATRLSLSGRARAETMVDLIWKDYSGPLFRGFMKLWVAAADDAELHARLVPIERKMGQRIFDGGRELAGELAEAPDFDARLTTVLASMRGFALSHALAPGRPHPLRPEIRAVLAALLAP